jgi:hypothetical protein
MRWVSKTQSKNSRMPMGADGYDQLTFLEIPLELMFLTPQHEIHLDIWEEFLEFGYERVGIVIPECELLLLPIRIR